MVICGLPCKAGIAVRGRSRKYQKVPTFAGELGIIIPTTTQDIIMNPVASSMEIPKPGATAQIAKPFMLQ
mgnify:CR=1 FL=1